MSPGFVYLRPSLVVCARVRGPYETSSAEAWRQMFAWLTESGMRRDVGCGYGLMRDDPAKVGAAACRYDACIALLPGYENLVPGGFCVQPLPGGAYARRRQVGWSGLRSEIERLRHEWSPSEGLAIDPNRPFIEIYHDNPLVVSEGARKIDICVPVAMDGAGSLAA
jgi:AraC family transcriptional regulator